MARLFRIELDHAGMEEMLKSDEVAALIAEKTEQIAELAKDTDESPYPVAVHHYVTDRAAGSVSIPAAAQAIRGTLGRAAHQAGLEVTEVDIAQERQKKAKRRKAARKGAATRKANAETKAKEQSSG